MSIPDRFGGEVWRAIQALDMEHKSRNTGFYWYGAGEIAVEAGVSRPTARKYLSQLIEQGYVSKSGSTRFPLYALTVGY